MKTDDLDIKIAGDKPSEDIFRNKKTTVQSSVVTNEQINGAKTVGKAVAESFIADAEISVDDEFRDYDMLLQRRLLLSFTAKVGFEQYILMIHLSVLLKKAFLIL